MKWFSSLFGTHKYKPRVFIIVETGRDGDGRISSGLEGFDFVLILDTT